VQIDALRAILEQRMRVRRGEIARPLIERGVAVSDELRTERPT
jgi:hypothetical protein